MTAFKRTDGGYSQYPEGSLLEDAPRHKTDTELINYAIGDGSEKGKAKGRKRWSLNVTRPVTALRRRGLQSQDLSGSMSSSKTNAVTFDF